MESAPFALYHNSVWDRGGGCWDSTSLIRRGVLSEWVLWPYPLTCDKPLEWVLHANELLIYQHGSLILDPGARHEEHISEQTIGQKQKYY